eukprot:TRINITY_DN64317_c0_g1_i1.p1 TRINITY_DN64317_c0_g1~~TRINITY_DN64317_c0_g1_i1.p1  ORF type:complete len:154 (+),score=30.98 TRINITY_DN64317_c0_g1_i1:95-556(+)
MTELWVTVETLDGWLNEAASTYVTCTVSGLKKATEHTKFHTPINENESCAEWNYRGEISLPSIYDSLFFEVYKDGGLVANDTLIGKAYLDAAQFYPNGFRGQIALFGGSKKGATLSIRVQPRSFLDEVRRELWRQVCGVSPYQREYGEPDDDP